MKGSRVGRRRRGACGTFFIHQADLSVWKFRKTIRDFRGHDFGAVVTQEIDDQVAIFPGIRPGLLNLGRLAIDGSTCSKPEDSFDVDSLRPFLGG